MGSIEVVSSGGGKRNKGQDTYCLNKCTIHLNLGARCWWEGVGHLHNFEHNAGP
jgi:hypothetical protein